MTITAAADGSALGNPGPAGWAWFIDENSWAAGGWPHGTNNQGELMAVLDLFKATEHIPEEPLRILCDSQYVINCITKWMPGWKRKGWRKADGKPVLNVDLLKQIDAAIKGRNYQFEWVKGHAGHELNEAADLRARAVASAFQTGSLVPHGPGFAGARSRPAEGKPAVAESAVAAHEPQLPPEPEEPGEDEPNVHPAGAAMLAEPDLFSVLDDYEGGLEEPAEDVVLRLEKELLDPATRADFGRLGVLLHPDFVEIGQSGRMWTRDAMINSLQEDPETEASLELFAAERLGEDSILLTYRTSTRTGSALRSSLWLRDGEQWRVRFHQGTPEQN
ncbi:RNase H [Arthrobacter crystallopoietes BAB-32]|uniref:Ribonuclease H n=1 Tax=Arthrobacter crystallopoietes BAB-32 TaxID=1246476 RepID=N1V1I0_9MICC|nr:ribonuclease HI family protein [Arthrobacter crystallopoietes]EMY35195.1 RNase H [Arthrobacter crystallopoietes BAB-32]